MPNETTNFHPRQDSSMKATRAPIPTTVAACGKVIIIGEHAVVYGARALAMPIPQMQMILNMTPIQPPATKTNLYEILMNDQDYSEALSPLVDDALKVLELPKFDLKIVGTSSIPLGGGLGSSAALCVALLRSLARSHGFDIPIMTLATYACDLERRFHGTPSGLDTSVVSFQNFISFRKDPLFIEPMIPSLPCAFALIDSGERASTATMVQQAAPYFTGENGQILTHKFDTLTQSAINGLETNDLDKLADAMTEAFQLLRTISIVTPQLTEIAATCLKLGAKAAKSTGAGGGGFILALLDSKNEHNTMARLNRTFGSKNVHIIRTGSAVFNHDFSTL